MTAIELISSAIKNDPERPQIPGIELVEEICAVTGKKCLCLPRKELLGKSFTNGDLLAAPESRYVGIDAYSVLKYKWERMSSWFCDGVTFERLDRQNVREKVFAEEMPQIWSAYVTTSYKKHGSLKAPVNTGKSRRWLFEMRIVDLTDFGKVLDWWGVLNENLRAGISRSIMETLDCPPNVIDLIGLQQWLNFESWARPKYLSALYAFLCYLLPSKEELKNEA